MHYWIVFKILHALSFFPAAIFFISFLLGSVQYINTATHRFLSAR